MGWLQKVFGAFTTTEPHGATRRTASIRWRDGSFPMGAVGGSNYQEALERITGGHNREGHEFWSVEPFAPGSPGRS